MTLGFLAAGVLAILDELRFERNLRHVLFDFDARLALWGRGRCLASSFCLDVGTKMSLEAI
jgi:hypothetical protein